MAIHEVSKLERPLAALRKRMNVEFLFALYDMVLFEDAVVPKEAVATALAPHSDDDLISGYAMAEYQKQTAIERCELAARSIAVEIERRLHERRKARGNDEVPIEIPHELVDVVLAPEFAPYVFDADQARVAAESCPDEKVRAKLLTVIPAHTEPEQIIAAYDVPEQVKLGSVASWKSARDRYAGTPLGKLIAASFKRDRVRDTVTIRLKKRAPLPRGAR